MGRDEMASSHKLDNVFCKDASGGTQALITGRYFDSKENFCFHVKFGMLLSFNQGCMPDLHQDPVLYQRMLMAKFRTKFIGKSPVESYDEFAKRMAAYEHCYEQDERIEEKMASWRSAAFDYFIEAFSNKLHLLDTPPESFVEFRDELVREDNNLADWFAKHFSRSDDPNDHVQVGEIQRYLSLTESSELVRAPRKRKELFEMCLVTNGFVVYDRKRVRDEAGTEVMKRKVALGVKFEW